VSRAHAPAETDAAGLHSIHWVDAKVLFEPDTCRSCDALVTRASITGWIDDEGDLVVSTDSGIVSGDHAADCELK
jgi:hypothetical protein